MGYSTSFEGKFTLDKKVDDETYTLLKGIATTRRMQRNCDPKYGVEGEFFVDQGFTGQEKDNRIINNNRPPSTQPGLWCQWLIQEDHETIEWDYGEKFYMFTAWITYLIERILKPRGYSLQGRVHWEGEDHDDIGTLIIYNNRVTEVQGEHISDANSVKYITES